MHDHLAAFYAPHARPLAIVLGTNEIASASAVRLARGGYAVVLSHDAFPPVIRRAMSFHDVLFGDAARLDGIDGERAESFVEIAAALAKPSSVAVTRLHLGDLLALQTPALLVDARMQKNSVTPDYRGLAQLTVGLGPNFTVDRNCDLAVETHPGMTGRVIEKGATEAADGVARRLGRVGRERFVYSDREGRWHTPVDIGVRVYKGVMLGRLDRLPIYAPIDGVLRGIARDGTHVPGGVKLIEIDPRGRDAAWTGIDERGRAIADAVLEAIRLRVGAPAEV